MNRTDRYSLLLLAGGKSSRMGRDKATLMLEGKTFPQHLIHKARRLGIEQIYISGHPLEGDGLRTVWDEYPDRGPLGGIHACMKAMETPFCIVLPVDMPLLPGSVIEELIRFHNGREDVVLWQNGQRLEPLVGIYPTGLAGLIEEYIREKPVPVFRVLDRCGYTACPVEIPLEQSLNVNTPENYQSLLRAAEIK